MDIISQTPRVSRELVPILKTELCDTDDASDLQFENETCPSQEITTVQSQQKNMYSTNFIVPNSDSVLHIQSQISQEVVTTITTQYRSSVVSNIVNDKVPCENQDNHFQDLVAKIKTELVEPDFDDSCRNEDDFMDIENKIPFCDDIVPKIKQEIQSDSNCNSDYKNYLKSKTNIEPKVPITKNLISTIKSEVFDLEYDSANQVPFSKDLIRTVKLESSASKTNSKNQKSSASRKKTIRRMSKKANTSKTKNESSKFPNIEDPVKKMILKIQGDSVLRLVPVIEKLDSSNFQGQINLLNFNTQGKSNYSTTGRNLRKRVDKIQLGEKPVSDKQIFAMRRNEDEDQDDSDKNPDYEQDIWEGEESHDDADSIKEEVFKKKKNVKSNRETLIEKKKNIGSDKKMSLRKRKQIDSDKEKCPKRKKKVESEKEKSSEKKEKIEKPQENYKIENTKRNTAGQQKKIELPADSDLKEEDIVALNTLLGQNGSININDEKRRTLSKAEREKLEKYIKRVEYDKKYFRNNCIKKKVDRKMNYTCKICNFKLDHGYNFLQHMFRHSGEKPFLCKICGKGFLSAVKARIHLEVHVKWKKFKCNYCSYKCRDKGNMKIHLREHTGEKPYKCRYCEYRSKQSAHLKRHTLIHSDKRPYKCNYCDYRCKDNFLLKCHTRIHTKEKPYKCEYCDYSSTQHHCIVVHRRIHTKEKPYKCNDCSYESNNRQCITSHIKRIHLKIKIFCKKCEYSCYDNYDLRRHERLTH